MKKAFFFTAALIAAFCITSCNNAESPAIVENNEKQTVESFLGKERLAAINESIETYSTALDETIDHFLATGRNDVSSDELDTYLRNVLESKVTTRAGGSGVYLTINAAKLQTHMDKLSLRFEAAETSSQYIDSDAQAANFFDIEANSYFLTVINDKTLTDAEKTDIITGGMISTGILCSNIENVDNFISLYGDYELRSLGSWIKRKWKKIKCAIGIVTTVGGGILGVYVPIAGVPVAGAGYGIAYKNC